MFIFLFFILGFISIIGQVVILREVTATFYGNEFFMGVVLASWIGWVAIGALKLSGFIKESKRFLCLCFLLAAFLLPLEIFIIRLSKNLVASGGQMPNLFLSLLLAVVITAPLPLILGLIFPLANRMGAGLVSAHSDVGADFVSAHSVSRAYLFEIIGFISGGLTFNFILIWLNEFKVTFLLGGLAILVTFKLLKGFSFKIPTLLLALGFFVIFLSPLSDKINFYTSAVRFPSQKLAELTNSLSGNIAVTESEGQYNFYENGIFITSHQEKGFSEVLAHFPLLTHPHPQKVLLVGSGASGAITEILKHKPSEVTWVELDPKLIEISYKYATKESRISIDDARVNSIATDARYFLTCRGVTCHAPTNQKFDAIIVNLPDPFTALINRFYTREFFEEAKNKLTSDGIFAFFLSSSPNYLNPSLRERNTLIYQTLKNIFSSVVILPEEEIFFIASQNEIDKTGEILIKRLKARNIETGLVTPDYIKYRLTNERVEEISKLLSYPSVINFNQDLKPHGYFLNALYWQSFFYPKLAKFFGYFLKIKLWQVLLVFGIAYSLIFLRVKKSSKGLSFLVMATGGLTLMASEVLLIYLFQITEGYIYHKIALLITAIMAGMALGNWYATKKLKVKSFTRQSFAKQNLGGQELKVIRLKIVKIHLGLVGFCLGIFPLIIFMPNSITFLLGAVLVGFLVGMEFPLANQLFFKGEPEPNKKTGVIYGADVLGSCLGAILLCLFFIPILGIIQALIILAFINILIILIVKFSFSRE